MRAHSVHVVAFHCISLRCVALRCIFACRRNYPIGAGRIDVFGVFCIIYHGSTSELNNAQTGRHSCAAVLLLNRGWACALGISRIQQTSTQCVPVESPRVLQSQASHRTSRLRVMSQDTTRCKILPPDISRRPISETWTWEM